ncbi:MAG TPA: serine hydrolase domain-containing protein [Chitinophagaceae bacterium]|nr:serine hydrolase domain-containing protein [Chitinophagaceae bacterium]
MKNQLLLGIAILTIVGYNEKRPAAAEKGPLKYFHSLKRSKKTNADVSSLYKDAIEDFYNSTLAKRNFNGQFLVAKAGSIIVEKYNGREQINRGDSITEHTAFHIASTTKTFTSGAILKLWEQGKLNIDDPIAGYFPNFPYKDITIKMLLNQRSGLPGYNRFDKKPDWDFKTPVTNYDVLSYLIKYKPKCDHLPDKAFQYSNTNFAILALIIEKVSGKSYGDYLKETFFTPLQMKDTYVYTPDDSDKVLPSFNWRGRKEGFTFLDDIYGDKNIYSTVKDLLKWDQALYTTELFKPETLNAAFTPYSNEKPGINNYGLGWRMKLYPNGKKIIFHNGWWHGNNSCFQRVIQDSVTIIVLGNRFNRNIYHCNKIANIFDAYNLEEDTEE